MATCFDRWEKDPFFSAAEEVQESADRMESAYRHWIHQMKRASSSEGNAPDLSGEVRRELHTALGTVKWQLEELERAVRSSDEACAAGEDARARHSQFVAAIGNRISTVENSLRESNFEGDSELTWVRLDEGERDELALFLSCSSPEKEKVSVIPSVGLVEVRNKILTNDEAAVDCLKSSCHPNELGRPKKEERVNGHRRTASASPDIESWKIAVSEEDDHRPNQPPPKIPSFSCLSKVMESTPKMKWPRNGFRKWKGGDQQQAEESTPLRNHQFSRGIDACYERSKSCLSSCAEETYEKELYGWLGALHRQLQRSQYHIQYGRPVQMIFWAVIVVLLIVLLAFRAT